MRIGPVLPVRVDVALVEGRAGAAAALGLGVGGGSAAVDIAALAGGGAGLTLGTTADSTIGGGDSRRVTTGGAGVTIRASESWFVTAR